MGRGFTPDDLREVRKVARQVGRRWRAVGYDDLVQEGALEVWRCLDRFDPSRASRAAWVGWVARRGMVEAARRWSGRAGTRKQAAYVVPLDEAAGCAAGRDPADVAVAAVTAQRLAATATTQERAVMAGVLADRPLGEVAAGLGRSPGRVSQLLRSLERKAG